MGGFLGLLVGWMLGKAAPAYYRGVFEGGQDRRFDPVSVGIGLGTSQGMMLGLLAGLGLVALLIWREIKLKEKG